LRPLSNPLLNPLRLGFRVCDRRHPFLWSGAGQASGRWNRTGDQPVHYLASTPTVAWAEWIRHQEITDPGDLAGVAAALWAVLIPQEWGTRGLDPVALPLHHSDKVLPAVRVSNGSEQPERLAMPAQVILLWCEARLLPGWCCVPEGRPGAELLPLVRREKLLTL